MTASAIMTPLGLAALKAREGVRLTAYRDSVGVPTIGYGHTRGVTLGQVITQAQADALFLEDLAGHALPILSCIAVPVADHERDALISIAFNIGVGGFRRSRFLRLLNAGDREGCAAAILAWRKPPEIVSRRQAEHDQFRTPYASAAPRARRGDPRPVAAPVSSGPSRPLPATGAFARLWRRLRPPLAAPARAAGRLSRPSSPRKDIVMSITQARSAFGRAITLLPVFCIGGCAAAQAAETDVTLHWGDAVITTAQALGAVLIPLAVTAASAAAARVAGPLRFLVTTTLVERMVRNAADYAQNAVAGAVRGKSLTIPVVARLIFLDFAAISLIR